MNFFRFFTLGILLTASISCTRSILDSPAPPPVSDAKGFLYVNVVGYFMKMDASTDSVAWWGQTINLFGSVGNPMTFDGENFYHGNNSGLTCYSGNSGLPVWMAGWLAFDDAIKYQEPAFNDSLIFYTAPTSYWDHGYLYCYNKLTRAFRWQIQLDSGNAEISFNGIPELYRDKVILLTRNAYNQKILKAFSIVTGELQWATPVSDQMSSKFRVEDGRIYSAYGPTAVCMDAATGQLIWSTDTEVPSCWWTHNFIDGDKLTIVKVMNNNTYKVIIIQKSSGAVIRRQDFVVSTTYTTFNLDLVPIGCSKNGNNLVIASFYSADSMDILCYDINTMAENWTKRIANSLMAGAAPVLSDKYIIFPVNDRYNTSDNTRSRMIFLDYGGNMVKELPFHATYTDGFVYKENGVLYSRSIHY